MKRAREQAEVVDSNLATLLMVLSSNVQAAVPDHAKQPSGRMFECKTCNRQFSSFQALGGHRASHKKPRPADGPSGQAQQPLKPRVHECSICGLEFSLGQALGGHMRRHRAELEGAAPRHAPPEHHHPTREDKAKDATHAVHVVHHHHDHAVDEDDEEGSMLTLDLNMPAPLENDPMLTLCLGLPLVH